MTLEEAIIHAEKIAEVELDARSYALEWRDNEEAEKCQKCADEHRQLAEWLRELAERRKQPEIIRCKDCRFNDGTAYCVFHFRDVKGEDYCSWAERRTE